MADSSSSEEVVAPKAKAPKIAAVVADESDSEEVVAPKAKAVRPVVESDSDSDKDEAPPTRKITQKISKVIEAGSDDSDSDGEPAATKTKDAAKTTDKESGKKAKEQPKQESEITELRVYVSGLPWKATADDIKKDFAKCGDIKNLKLLQNEQGKSKGVAFITFKTPEGMTAAIGKNGDKETYPGRVINVSKAKSTTPENHKKMVQEKSKNKKEADKAKFGSGEIALGDSNIFNINMLRRLTHAQENKDFHALENLGRKIASRARLAIDERQSKNKKRDKAGASAFVTGIPTTDFDTEAFKKRFQDCGMIVHAWMPVKPNGENKGFGRIVFKNKEGFEKALAYNGTKCKGSVLKVVKSVSHEAFKDTGTNGEKGDDSEAKKKRKDAPIQDGADAKQEKKKKKLLAEEPEDPPKKEKKKKAVEEEPVAEEVVVKKKKNKASE